MVKNDIEKIKNYYKGNDDLLIVGLGDNRGVNFEKNVLLLLKEALDSNDYDIKTIDTFSILLNKSRYIDYYLKHNISTEQLKKIQMYGTENEIKYLSGNKNFGTLLGVMGSYLIKDANEENLYISDELKNSNKPIVIYSSGISDIMYETQIITPNSREKNNVKKYNFNSLMKTNEQEQAMNNVIDGNKRNIENILGLNEDAKICVLGLHNYSNANKSFNKFILNYNERLKEVCKNYKLIYVGTRNIEKINNHCSYDTYFRKYSFFLTSRIIKELSFSLDKQRNIEIEPFEYDSEGAYGVLNDMKDYKQKIKKINPVKYVNTEKDFEREENTVSRVVYY